MTKQISDELRRYYASWYWADRKDRYYARHPRRCKACGSRFGVQLHHISYRVLWGRERDRDLMPLCGSKCHPRVDFWRSLGMSRRTATWTVVVFGRLGF